MARSRSSDGTYRGEGLGAASFAPLDIACGMSGRFMTPNVEEVAPYAAALVTAREVNPLLAKSPQCSPLRRSGTFFNGLPSARSAFTRQA